MALNPQTGKTNAEGIRDETVENANTAGTVGSNMVDVWENIIVLDDAKATPETLIIRSLSELPSPIGGEVQLLDNTIYIPQFTSAQSMSDTLVFGSNTTWFTPNSGFAAWTYTGSTEAIKASGGNSIFIFGMQVTLSNGSAKAIDFDGNLSAANIVLERFTSIGGNVGVFKDTLFTFFSECNFAGFTDGVLFQGSNSDISIQTARFDTYVNTAIDLGTATTTDLLMTGVRFVGGAVGSFCLSGLVDSGNITGRATISNSIWNGLGSSLNVIDNCDLKYKFNGNVGNPGVEDSRASATIYITTANEAATSITGGDGDLGNPKGIAGTWTVKGSMCRFTADLNTGILTYIGLEETELIASSAFLVDPASGSNIEYFVSGGYKNVKSKVLSNVSTETMPFKKVQSLSFSAEDSANGWCTPCEK